MSEFGQLSNIIGITFCVRKMKRENMEKIRRKLTPYELRKLREGLRVRTRLSVFQKELRKHLTTFITGAVAFVAALLWRDAIQSFLSKYEKFIQSSFPLKEEWMVKTFTAFIVSVVAVAIIVIISKTLGIEEK